MTVPDRIAGKTPGTQTPLQMTIKPAAESVTGGQRLPVQFTIRNSGDQPVHACLTSGRVIHLWGVDQQYAYTVAEQSASASPCEDTLDLPPHGERSWNEEIAIPAAAAGAAKLVGFAQIAQSAGCTGSDCQAVWLTASYAPFKIEEGAAPSGPVLDLRTGIKAAALTSFSTVPHH